MADLDPSATKLLWINDISGFMVAGLLFIMGMRGGRFGRRKMLAERWLRAATFPTAVRHSKPPPTALTSRKEDAGGARPG